MIPGLIKSFEKGREAIQEACMDFQLYEGRHTTAIACQILQLYHSTTYLRLGRYLRTELPSDTEMFVLAHFKSSSPLSSLQVKKQEVDGLHRHKASTISVS